MPRLFSARLFAPLLDGKLFVVSLKMKEATTALVQQHLSAHHDFLKKQFDEGRFLTAGNKIDHSGEIIIAGNVGLEALQAILQEDPFIAEDLSEYTIRTFLPSMNLARFRSVEMADHATDLLLVLLHYQAPLAITLSEIDKLIPEHKDFLEKNYRAGHFLISGRMEPRSGGVILTEVPVGKAIEELLADDPFAVHGLASSEVIRFTV